MTGQSILLAWYDENKRDLPWRQTHDAYSVWLSEVILQQTRVAQGTEYYYRFLHTYPDVRSLAAADEDEVLHLWQGLGYYSRARNLLKAARIVAGLGGFPNEYEQLRRLPGVGDYTAAAIASIAFGKPYAVVDGNVYRILSRFYTLAVPRDTTEGKRTYASLAQEWLPAEAPGLHNQAMMDLGATICLPRSPRCECCPLGDACMAHAEGRQEEFPKHARRKIVRTRHFVYLYLRCGSEIFLHRRGRGDIWQGLYEPMLIEFNQAPTFAEISASAHLPEGCIYRLVAKGLRHQLTHQLLVADAYVVKLTDKPGGIDGIWIDESVRSDYGVSRLVENIYNIIDGVLDEEPACQNQQ